ncbi:MAG: response regulator transcription factor [Gaiellaceae bacterium]
MGAPIRILLVEDNDVYRASLELLFEMQEGLDVVGGVSDGAAAAAACAELRADVVLMDLRLPGLDGPAATQAVRAACPTAAVLCLTAEATDEEAAAMTAAGAVGIARKGGPVDVLVGAVRRAAVGDA